MKMNEWMNVFVFKFQRASFKMKTFGARWYDVILNYLSERKTCHNDVKCSTFIPRTM